MTGVVEGFSLVVETLPGPALELEPRLRLFTKAFDVLRSGVAARVGPALELENNLSVGGIRPVTGGSGVPRFGGSFSWVRALAFVQEVSFSLSSDSNSVSAE